MSTNNLFGGGGGGSSSDDEDEQTDDNGGDSSSSSTSSTTSRSTTGGGGSSRQNELTSGTGSTSSGSSTSSSSSRPPTASDTGSASEDELTSGSDSSSEGGSDYQGDPTPDADDGTSTDEQVVRGGTGGSSTFRGDPTPEADDGTSTDEQVVRGGTGGSSTFRGDPTPDADDGTSRDNEVVRGGPGGDSVFDGPPGRADRDNFGDEFDAPERTEEFGGADPDRIRSEVADQTEFAEDEIVITDVDRTDDGFGVGFGLTPDAAEQAAREEVAGEIDGAGPDDILFDGTSPELTTQAEADLTREAAAAADDDLEVGDIGIRFDESGDLRPVEADSIDPFERDVDQTEQRNGLRQEAADELRRDAADELEGVAESDLRVVERDGQLVAELDASDDDLPRLAELTGQGDSEFRRDGRLRSFSQDVAEGGGDFVGSGLASVGGVIGADASQQRVLSQTGQNIGALPGSLGLVTADAVDASVSVGSATRSDGVTGAADQVTDLQTDFVDFGLGGVDRATDIDRDRRASGEGALVEFDTTGTRDEETAGALTAGALLLGASGPVSAGARAGAARAPSPSGTSASLRRFATDDRAQTQVPRGQRRDRDGGDPVESGFNEDVRADLRQDSLTQTQDQLRPQARREQRAQRDLVDDPTGPDPIGGGGRGPTFDPDAPQPAGPSRFGQQRQAGQELPRGFADLDRAGNVPRTDLRATVEPTSQSATPSGRFGSGAAAGSAAAGGPSRQPNPGGLVVDDRGQIRDESRISGVEEDTAISGIADASDELLGTEQTQPDTTDGVTGVGVKTDAESDTGTFGGTGFEPIQDTDTRPTSREDTQTGQRTAQGQRTGQAQRTGQQSRAGQRTRQPRTVTDLIPGQQQRTQTRTRTITRPTPRPPRPRPPNFEFGSDTGRERQSADSASLDVFGRGDSGPLAVGFGAETIDALARGAFRERELPDEIGTGPSPEIPTAGLVEPDEEDEEAVGFVSDLFGLDAGNENGASGGLLDFGGGDRP